jgi:hypothetical protein
MRTTRSLFARIATFALAAVVAAPLYANLQAQTSVPTDTASASTASSTPAARDSILLAPFAAPSQAAVIDETPASRSGAPLTGLRSGIHTRETTRTLSPAVAANHANLGQSKAMMVVGAAALITGAIIGGTPGTIIMVGGAVIGLYGLYEYLQ